LALRIEFDELTGFKRSCDDKSVLWGTSLEALMNSTTTFVEMVDFRGAAATSIKSYLTEVHYTVIWALMDILTELSVKLLLYKDGYNQIDEALHAKFSENVLNDILRFFQGSQYDFDDTHLRLQQTADSISDIMYAPMPSAYSVTNDYSTVLRDQNRLKEDLLNHESSHYANDFTNLDQLIANLETFISEAQCVDRNTMSLYQSGAVAQSLAFCNLVEDLLTTEAQWQSMGEQLQAVYDREQVRLEAEQRVEDGKFQIFTSILEIAGGVLTIVVSVGAIVGSCGAATPLAVVGIVGGVGMIIHGSSNLQEGIEMVSLGSAGNMADSPRSWLRDSVMGPVFGEENKQLAFDIFGYASAAMGVVGSAGASAWASATKAGVSASGQILRAVLVEEAKVGVSAVGGILGGKGSGWVATNVFGVDENTARYVEVIGGIAAGAATYRGVNALDKRFNWNGLNPKPPAVEFEGPTQSDIDRLRAKWDVPEKDTIAVGKTDVEGLETTTFEGGSPRVRQQAGLTDLDTAFPDRPIKAPYENPAFTRHAEEDIISSFVKAVEDAGISPEDVKGTLSIRQSNANGVCYKCLSGLENSSAKIGIIKQLSLKYPNLIIDISSPVIQGHPIYGQSFVTVQNGQFLN